MNSLIFFFFPLGPRSTPPEGLKFRVATIEGLDWVVPIYDEEFEIPESFPTENFVYQHGAYRESRGSEGYKEGILKNNLERIRGKIVIDIGSGTQSVEEIARITKEIHRVDPSYARPYFVKCYYTDLDMHKAVKAKGVETFEDEKGYLYERKGDFPAVLDVSENIRLVAGSSFNLPFARNFADVIMEQWMILSHLGNHIETYNRINQTPEWRQLGAMQLLHSIHEKIRVLKPGGLARIGPVYGPVALAIHSLDLLTQQGAIEFHGFDTQSIRQHDYQIKEKYLSFTVR